MLIFWIAAFLLVGVSLALLLPPLLKPARHHAADTHSEKLVLYRQQFDDLAQDRNAGLLAEHQYAGARRELEHRLLAETSTVPQSAASGAVAFAADKRLAMLILISLPLFAGLIYQKIGNPGVIKQLSAQQASEVNTSEIEPILASLREKLDQDPNDVAGWALLGRAYGKLRQFDKASFAFEKAVKLTPDDAQLLTDYAVVLAMTNQHQVAGKPEALIGRALEIDPRNPTALMLGASIAFGHKDYNAAIKLWKRLQPDLPVGSEMAASVEASLAQAKALSKQTAKN